MVSLVSDFQLKSRKRKAATLFRQFIHASEPVSNKVERLVPSPLLDTAEPV